MNYIDLASSGHFSSYNISSKLLEKQQFANMERPLFLVVCIISLLFSKSLLQPAGVSRFSAILHINGSSLCILDQPSAEKSAVSVIGCGSKCALMPLCFFYNFISAAKRCQMFSFTVSQFAVEYTCSGYQLQVRGLTICCRYIHWPYYYTVNFWK